MYEAPLAVAAADLEHPLTLQIDLCRRAVVELDEVAVGLVGGRQRQTHYRVLLIAGVEEQHIVVADDPGQLADTSTSPRNFQTDGLKTKRFARGMEGVWQERQAATQWNRPCGG